MTHALMLVGDDPADIHTLSDLIQQAAPGLAVFAPLRQGAARICRPHPQRFTRADDIWRQQCAGQATAVIEDWGYMKADQLALFAWCSHIDALWIDRRGAQTGWRGYYRESLGGALAARGGHLVVTTPARMAWECLRLLSKCMAAPA